MLRRDFTAAERLLFLAHAARVRDEVDAELGGLLLRVADGDDEALAAVHDRANVLGRHDIADRIRRLVTE